jgi:hypothetical protein
MRMKGRRVTGEGRHIRARVLQCVGEHKARTGVLEEEEL